MESILFKAAEINISYSPRKNFNKSPTISSSKDAVPVLFKGFNKDTIGIQEQFVVMYLNRANKILGLYKASIGGLTATVLDQRLLLSIALKIGCTSFIMAHNHPSGSLKPSIKDQELTAKIQSAALLFDIVLLDHLILNGVSNFFSFEDAGLL